MTPRPVGRPTPRVFAAIALVLAFGASVACIIAEPTPEVPQIPEFRPTILQGSVDPPAGAILGRFPTNLKVQVELVDPKMTFEWSLYVDYNPLTGEGRQASGEVSSGGQPARIRKVEIPLNNPPSDLDRCHVIEVLVAKRFLGRDGRGAHTPDEPGGDSVTWIVSPGGDLRGCPVPDAGVTPPSDASGDRDAGGA